MTLNYGRQVADDEDRHYATTRGRHECNLDEGDVSNDDNALLMYGTSEMNEKLRRFDRKNR